ncbi:MAG: hypothetical protein ABIT83_01995 [Massilia sp.]
MKTMLPPCAALALALCLLGGCKDRHEPVKPTVAPAPASAPR